MKNKSKLWTDADIELLTRMRKQGSRNREIATFMGRSLSAIKGQVRRCGLQQRENKPPQLTRSRHKGRVVKFVPGMTVAKARPKRVGPDYLRIEPVRPCGFDGCETSTKGRYCAAHALAMHRAVPHTKVRGEDMVPEVSRY